MMGGIARRSPMLFPANARIPSIDIVGGGTPETLQNGHGGGYSGSATDEAQWPIGPQTTGWGIAAPSPLSDAAGQLVDVVGGWARKMAGSGRVSSAVAHLSKRRHGARREVAITDLLRNTGYGRPQASDAVRRSAESQCSFLFPIEARSVLVSLVVCQCVASKPSTQIV